MQSGTQLPCFQCAEKSRMFRTARLLYISSKLKSMMRIAGRPDQGTPRERPVVVEHSAPPWVMIWVCECGDFAPMVSVNWQAEDKAP